MMWYKSLLLLATLVTMATADFAEKITEDGASGAEVVEHVVNLIGQTCIFGNDLFLRRMAHVETKDGTAADTYRAGYDGGIWNIDQTMFLDTQNNSALRSAYDVIKKELHVDWSSVAWKDVRRPIISGLAASLFVLSRNFKTIPEGLELQATIWSVLRPGNVANDFYFDAVGLNTSCNGDRKLDLVLILDFANASVFDIVRVEGFMESLLKKFHLDPSSTRVGLVTRDKKPAAGWYLNSQKGGLTILNVLKALRYRPGPATTEDALAFARQTMFSPSNGARTGAVRVALLITDGITQTKDVHAEAGKFLHEGVTLMVVDINKGSTQLADVHGLVQEPKCQNSRQINDFSELPKLSDGLANFICYAPIILTEGTYTYPCGTPLVAKLPDTTNSVSVQVSTTADDVDIFGSKIYSSPDKSSNDVHVTSTASESPVLFVRGTDPFYLRFQGKNSLGSCTGSFTVHVTTGQGPTGGNGTCIVAGTVRDCTGPDMAVAARDLILTKTDMFPYLCDPRNHSLEYFPHPLHSSKFVMCDEHEDTYIGLCPGNQSTCLPITSGCKYTNPCSRKAELNGSDYFIDPCGKQEVYVKCSFFGMAEVMHCHGGQVWNQDTDKCVSEYVHDPLHNTDAKNVPNPCVHSHADHVYFPYPNSTTRYIFCDVRGNAYALTCRHGEWNQQTKSCTTLTPPRLFG